MEEHVDSLSPDVMTASDLEVLKHHTGVYVLEGLLGLPSQKSKRHEEWKEEVQMYRDSSNDKRGGRSWVD